MTWNRVLTALATLVAIGLVAAVIYLENSNSSGAAATMTTLAATSTTTTLTPATTTSTTTTTLPPTTLPPTTLPPTTLPPPDRSLVPVVVSGGPSDGQRVGPGAVLIAAVGWSDIRPLTGSVALTDSKVFYVEGMQAAAELLAVDAGLPVTSVAPIAEAPPVAGLANAQLLFYFGGA